MPEASSGGTHEVVATAPGRVVLVGDHTDHAGGVSLTMAIDRATTVRGVAGGGRLQLTSDQLPGTVVLPSPPASSLPPWGRIVAAVADEVATERGPGTDRSPQGFVGRIRSTVPVGAGLASSAALGLAVALALGHDGSPLALARLGQRSEHRATGVPCGLLDQLTSACGEEGHALLLDLADDAVHPVPFPPEVEVVVVHSGQERSLEGSAYAERRHQCEEAARVLGPLPRATPAEVAALVDPVLRRRARHVASECARVREAHRALVAVDLTALGAVVRESHRSLRDDFEVSTPVLDALVERLDAVPGVLGARLTGAGFGGCVVALTEPGAIADPAALTGRGWRVRPAAGASVHPTGA